MNEALTKIRYAPRNLPRAHPLTPASLGSHVTSRDLPTVVLPANNAPSPHGPRSPSCPCFIFLLSSYHHLTSGPSYSLSPASECKC